MDQLPIEQMYKIHYVTVNDRFLKKIHSDKYFSSLSQSLYKNYSANSIYHINSTDPDFAFMLLLLQNGASNGEHEQKCVLSMERRIMYVKV